MANKSPIKGGIIKRPKPIDRSIFITSLHRNSSYFTKNKYVPDTDKFQAYCFSEGHADKACNALEVYIGQHRGTKISTYTERKRLVEKICKTAQSVIKNHNSQNAEKCSSYQDKLYDLIQQCDINCQAEINRFLSRSHGPSLHKLKNALNSTFCADTTLVINVCALLQKFDFNYLNDKNYNNYKDPFLPLLINTLSLIWSKVTGRTPFRTNLCHGPGYGYEKEKFHPFAEWLISFMEAAMQSSDQQHLYFPPLPTEDLIERTLQSQKI